MPEVFEQMYDLGGDDAAEAKDQQHASGGYLPVAPVKKIDRKRHTKCYEVSQNRSVEGH